MSKMYYLKTTLLMGKRSDHPEHTKVGAYLSFVDYQKTSGSITERLVYEWQELSPCAQPFKPVIISSRGWAKFLAQCNADGDNYSSSFVGFKHKRVGEILIVEYDPVEAAKWEFHRTTQKAWGKHYTEFDLHQARLAAPPVIAPFSHDFFLRAPVCIPGIQTVLVADRQDEEQAA